MNEGPVVRITEIPLNLILENPWLTPTSFKIKGHFVPDPAKVKKYFEILKDLAFHEYIKVWKRDGKYFVIDNYEAVLALREYYKGTPEKPVACLVIENADDLYIKTLAVRLQNISPSDSHTSRCLGIKILLHLKVPPAKIREIYGVTGSKTKEAKMFQRDYRIAKHDRIYNRVVGYVENEPQGVLDIAKPRISKATLSYALADKVLGILGDDEELIQAFDLAYEKYLQSLRKSHLHEDELVKPIFTWKTFNKMKVENIARYIIRKGEPTQLDPKYISGDASLEDQRWPIKYDEATAALTLPQSQINLASKDLANLKLITDLKYHAEKLVYALDSYLNKIRPTQHGAPVRVSSIDLRPVFGIDKSNVPKFVDKDYFNYIRKNKLLHYANRALLLKSIDLAAHDLGYESYRFDAEATYKTIHSSFQAWWDRSFIPKVQEYYQSDEKRHPSFNIYTSMMNYLNKKANHMEAVYFGDFISELFSVVFRELDSISESKERRLKDIAESDQDSKTALWDQIQSALRQNGLTEQDFLSVARELLKKDWDKSLAETEKLRVVLKKVAGGFEPPEPDPEDQDE